MLSWMPKGVKPRLRKHYHGTKKMLIEVPPQSAAHICPQLPVGENDVTNVVRATSELVPGVYEERRARKLLLCTYGFPPSMGPRGLRLLQLSRALAQRGWEIDVLTARQSPTHRLYDSTFSEES